MALNIPDILIINTLNKILNILRDDYNTHVAAGTEDRCILYLLFNDVSLGKYNFYDNAKQLIITTPEDPRHLEVRLSYDHTSTTWSNMVYVTLASETANANSLQVGEGDQEEIVFDNASPDQDEYRKQFMRRYSTAYTIMILAKNRNEMLVLFNLFKAMMVACINHLSLEGLSNIKIGGQDLRYAGSETGIFSRGINLNFDYEQVVPDIMIKKIFSKIRVILVADDSELRK